MQANRLSMHGRWRITPASGRSTGTRSSALEGDREVSCAGVLDEGGLLAQAAHHPAAPGNEMICSGAGAASATTHLSVGRSSRAPTVDGAECAGRDQIRSATVLLTWGARFWRIRWNFGVDTLKEQRAWGGKRETPAHWTPQLSHHDCPLEESRRRGVQCGPRRVGAAHAQSFYAESESHYASAKTAIRIWRPDFRRSAGW